MSEEPGPVAAEAVVETRSRPSAVWLIPLVAVLIGAFLVYRTFADRGPTITIAFKSAEGLEAGKTKIKYKDVELGVVDSIELAEDFSHVIVTAEMVKAADAYLTENTHFWVVRAQVSAGRVTGLGTLFSGAYIGMDPSKEGEEQRRFVGLENAPVVTSTDPGTLFVLRSDEGGSFEVGAPVTYRRIQVGEVVSSQLSDDGQYVTVQVFVRAPHDDRVHTSTRFWNASGLDVKVDASGIQVDTQSLTSVLIGGISFDSSETLEQGVPPPEDFVFTLHPNRSDAFSRSYAIKRRYLLNFTQSVEGLRPGAAVLFRGIRVGEVLDVRLELDRETFDFRVPVLIALEPERVLPAGQVPGDPKEAYDTLIAKGLRARLKSGNLLTGQKEIELVLIEDAEPVEIASGGRYPEIPTVPTPLEELTSNLTRIVERLGRVPIEDIGENLDRSLANLAATLENTGNLTKRLDTEVMPSLEAAVGDASALLSPTSTTTTELRQLLIELSEAARSLRLLTDYLERHPESLIQGKGEGEG